MGRDVRCPQRDAARLDARSDRAGRSHRRAHLGRPASARARRRRWVEATIGRRSFGTLNDTIRPLADPARILAETCRLLGTHLRVNRVAYGEIEGDDCTIVNDYVDGLPSQAGRFRWTELGGSRTEEILKGGTLFVNDTSTEPHTAAEREALQRGGHRRLHLSAARQGRPVRRVVRDPQPRAARVDARRDRARAGRRRSDLGDARAPQGGSRAARQRRAAGVSPPAQRRASAVERSRRGAGDCRTAPRPAPRRHPRRLCGIRRRRLQDSPRVHARGVAPLDGTHRRASPSARKCARRSGAARSSSSTTFRRIRG